MSAFFFGPIARVGHTRSRGEVNATDVQARFAEVNRALHGPPPEPHELRDARVDIHKQYLRDQGRVGLFE